MFNPRSKNFISIKDNQMTSIKETMGAKIQVQPSNILAEES